MHLRSQKTWLVMATSMAIWGLVPVLAKPISVSEAPDKSWAVVKSCVREGKCQYAVSKAPKNMKSVKPNLVLRNMPDGQIEWQGNIASFEYGGCGTSCFTRVFMHPAARVDFVQNPIFVDEKKQCVIYPTTNDLVVRRLFERQIIQQYAWTDAHFAPAKMPAALALIEAEKAKNGDVILTFDDEKGQEQSIRLSKPCEKK